MNYSIFKYERFFYTTYESVCLWKLLVCVSQNMQKVRLSELLAVSFRILEMISLRQRCRGESCEVLRETHARGSLAVETIEIKSTNWPRESRETMRQWRAEGDKLARVTSAREDNSPTRHSSSFILLHIFRFIFRAVSR